MNVDYGTHVSHVVGNLKVVDEWGAELRVEVEHVKQVVAVHAVQVAIGERAHATVAAPHRRVHARVLTEYVVLACKIKKYNLIEHA